MRLEEELEVLLQCWRRTRSSRVGDTLDRVSRELANARGPVAGKTVTARIANLLELVKARDPADLGRLLDVPWPGTWKKAVPVSKALRDAFVDDPRLEAHLARVFAEPPWGGWPEWDFFGSIVYALRSVTDARLIPLLEAGDARRQNNWYEGTFREGIRAAIKRLRETAPLELNPAELTLLTPIEARYAEEKSREKAKARGEAELLEAIYARPNDAQARAVFADWLTERNDPRGECIALQLAPERTRAQETRLNALLKKHGADWAGSLDEWFDRDERRYELGFLVGGKMVEIDPRPLEKALADPLWKLVNVLEVEEHREPPLALLPQLRELHNALRAYGTQQRAVLAILDGEQSIPLETLTLARHADLGALGDCRAAKKLRVLGLSPTTNLTNSIEKSPVLARVEKLILRGTEGIKELIELVAAKFPKVKTIEVLSGEGWLFNTGAWTFSLSREGPGPFTAVTGYTTNTELLAVIAEATEPAKVKSLRIEANRTLPLREAERASAEKLLAQFTSAHVEVPWEREAAASVKKAEGELFSLRLHGASFLMSDMQPLWSALTDAGLSFDAYSLGEDGTHRPLGPKPVVTLSKWGANKRTKHLELYRDGTEERLTLLQPEFVTGSDFHLAFHWNKRTSENFMTWLEALLAIRPEVRCGALQARDERFMLFGFETVSGRLNLFGGEFRKRLPEKKIIAAVKKLGGFVHAGKHALYFSPNATLDEKATVNSMRALREAVWPLIIEFFVERTGLDFEAEAQNILGAAVRALGFTKNAERREIGEYIRWSKGDVHVNVAFYRFFLQPTFRIELWKMYSKEGHYTLQLAEDGNLEQAALRAGLDAAVTMLNTEGPRWLEDPQHYKPPRQKISPNA